MDRLKRVKKSRYSLDELKKARANGSALDALDVDIDDSVYDIVDEDKYASIVETRRDAGDFVVDDEGLGYADDGEERFDDDNGHGLSSKRSRELSQYADKNLTRKARKLAENSMATGIHGTILKHLSTGSNAMSSSSSTKKTSTVTSLDLDALLEDTTVKSSRLSGSRSMFGRAMATRQAAASVHRSMMPSLVPSLNKNSMFSDVLPSKKYEGDEEEEVQQPSHDDNHHMEVDFSSDCEPLVMDLESEEKTSSIQVKVEKSNDDESLPTKTESTVQFKTEIGLDDDEEEETTVVRTTRKLKPTRSMKSTVVPIKEEPALPQLPDLKSSMNNLMNDSGLATVEVTSKYDPSYWLHTKKSDNDDGNDETFINFFYMDAFETNGTIYLFGRIPITSIAGGPQRDGVDESGLQTVSCCIAVHNCDRHLYILPKLTSANDSVTRYDMMTVRKEIMEKVLPSVLPRQEGRSFAMKEQKMKYAFEAHGIPRHETTYYMVKYPIKYPAPSLALCSAPGESYERIFGATSTGLEHFLLERNILGPGWLRIRSPKMTTNAVSWCKVELTVDQPTSISRLLNTPEDPLPRTPTLTSMSVSLKTAVNPRTHLHEVISISSVIHTRVDPDGDTQADPSTTHAFTIIRPLGLSCGDHYPATFPHDLNSEVSKYNRMNIMIAGNERALLSLFFAKIQLHDPDVLASHNLWGFEFEVILARAVMNKLPNWSLFGRIRKSRPPKSVADRDAFPGRILCDTYVAAKEFLRETTYSLTHLSQSQLSQERTDVDPVDVPRYFSSSNDILQLAAHTFRDATLVQGLLLRLQIVPLTKQLTNLSGNLWSRTVRSARAERIEYLLLHEFYAAGYVLPERKIHEKRAAATFDEGVGNGMNDEEEGAGKVGGVGRKRAKADYAGGLVLEPKRGLYDTYIVLLDFNSLYPSIIQEYNLCFTTIEWTKFMPANNPQTTKKAVVEGEEGEEDAEEEESPTSVLPPLPDQSVERGILPRVIKTLVDRRRAVKNLMKEDKSRDDEKLLQQLDIRQKAIKLTANSMYGCLGFSFSRFYARPIAALVTAMGREALQKTVDIARNKLSYDVIYGDTDSVMINSASTDLVDAKTIGRKVKQEVNALYKSLELEIDGVFRSMLLLKKKKYAAVVVNEGKDGSVSYTREMKGLDLVRRDWCPLSKSTGIFVVEEILSGKPRDEIVGTIREYLISLAEKLREGQIPLQEFIVTKGLNKNPRDYPDVSSQPHLQVALKMLKANKPVNVGDHIPYVITTQISEDAVISSKGNHSYAARAYHPDDILRGNETLKVDIDWYLTNQLLPPIARLCEPIEGLSQFQISQLLGLDSSKYGARVHDDDEPENWAFQSKLFLDDAKRFESCEILPVHCLSCKNTEPVRSVMTISTDLDTHFTCSCGSLHYGRTPQAFFAHLTMNITRLMRLCQRKYYQFWQVCDDTSCKRRTMQQTLCGSRCLEPGCEGQMIEEYPAIALYEQLKYLEYLFDYRRWINGGNALNTSSSATRSDMNLLAIERDERRKEWVRFSRTNRDLIEQLCHHMNGVIQSSAYNWVSPNLWAELFGATTKDSSTTSIDSKAMKRILA